MYRLFLYPILLLFLSCTQTDKNINEFENILGEKNIEALDKLVEDFEENLDKIYPDLSTENGYRQYLMEIISDSTTNWDKFKFQSDKTNKKFYKSGLWNEIYEKNSNRGLEINYLGKYMQALDAVKSTDPLIEKYWSKREAAGILHNKLFANGILSSDYDFNNYFHKRIVVVEFSF